jgi:uncharacterized protein YfkK (UPF0435 family)
MCFFQTIRGKIKIYFIGVVMMKDEDFTRYYNLISFLREKKIVSPDELNAKATELGYSQGDLPRLTINLIDTKKIAVREGKFFYINRRF